MTWDRIELERRGWPTPPKIIELAERDPMVMGALEEWKAGIVGPDGPHRVISCLTVDIRDVTSLLLAVWAFGGALWTAALSRRWLDTATPGAVWDAETPDVRYGHAMHISGYSPVAAEHHRFAVETWGLAPPVQVTYRGLLSAQSEVIVAFSRDQFTRNGISAFTGRDWEFMRQLWQRCGGRDVGPSPFAPAPSPAPAPPVPAPPAPAPLPTLDIVLGTIRAAFQNARNRSSPMLGYMLARVERLVLAAVQERWGVRHVVLAGSFAFSWQALVLSIVDAVFIGLEDQLGEMFSPVLELARSLVHAELEKLLT